MNKNTSKFCNKIYTLQIIGFALLCIYPAYDCLVILLNNGPITYDARLPYVISQAFVPPFFLLTTLIAMFSKHRLNIATGIQSLFVALLGIGLATVRPSSVDYVDYAFFGIPLVIAIGVLCLLIICQKKMAKD